MLGEENNYSIYFNWDFQVARVCKSSTSTGQEVRLWLVMMVCEIWVLRSTLEFAGMGSAVPSSELDGKVQAVLLSSCVGAQSKEERLCHSHELCILYAWNLQCWLKSYRNQLKQARGSTSHASKAGVRLPSHPLSHGGWAARYEAWGGAKVGCHLSEQLEKCLQ